MTEEKMNNDMERQIFEKMNNCSFNINRVPRNTMKRFAELAKEEFCDDYGMCLKWLIDGLVDKDSALIMERIDELEERIQSLETAPKEEPVKTEEKKMLNGRTIKVKSK